MEGTYQPSRYTSWIFTFEWPVSPSMEESLVQALHHEFLNWVVIPVTGITPALLQSEAQTLSMEMQDSDEF